MSLLSPKTFRQIALGGAKQLLGTIAEERAKGEEYLTTLAAAKEEVNNEGKIIGDNYNKALRVMQSTGNTGFNNFLYSEMSIDQLSALSNLAPTTRDAQLKQLKFQYEGLSDERKAELEKGNYAQEAKAAYDTEIENLKVKKNLVNNNRMGENTLESLITTGVRKKMKKEEDKIIGQAVLPEIDVSDVPEGAGIYGSIGETAFQDSRIKLMIDQDYIDGTMEDIVRNRLIMTNEIYNTSNEQIQFLINAEYNKQVQAAEKIFMTSGDSNLLPETKTTISTDDEVNKFIS
jgi:hypothetical protein